MDNQMSDDLLTEHNGRIIPLSKGDMLFWQGERAAYFFLVKSGRIKMTHYSEGGREFIQGYFTAGESFGEPPLFTKTPYPASAIAVEDSTVWRLSYEDFLNLLRNCFDLHLELVRTLSQRLIYKSMMLSEVAVEEAEHRLGTLMAHLHSASGLTTDEPYHVHFTRQALADMTGLRVETVVRTIKAMERKGMLKIAGGKIFWRPTHQSH